MSPMNLTESASRFHVVIPARYASTRFPGKPLAMLSGKSMIQRVHEQAMASGAGQVVVATDDERIAGAAREFGADVAMTSTRHSSGTERIAEVARSRGWSDTATVVNLQGDSPLMPAQSLVQAAGLLAAHPTAALATLCTGIGNAEEFHNPNVVKVVMDSAGRALYFSRSPIPCPAHGATGQPPAWRHLGIYAYRVGALLKLAASPPCELETVERLEQLRALWLGMEIRVAAARAVHGPDVDTPADVAIVERHLAGISAS